MYITSYLINNFKQLNYAELFVGRQINSNNLVFLEQTLPVCEHLLEKKHEAILERWKVLEVEGIWPSLYHGIICKSCKMVT